MNDLEDVIDNAIKQLSLDSSQCTKLSDSEIESTTEAIETIYVAQRTRFWWHELRHVVHAMDEPEAVRRGHISIVLPQPLDTHVLFIPDRNAHDGILNPIYLITPSSLDRLLAETWIYEYYVSSPRYEWLLASTDHNRIIICRIRP